MIPYAELCDALARWRSRQGLTSGPSARPPAAAAAAYSVPPSDVTATSVVAVGAGPSPTIDRTATNTAAVPAVGPDLSDQHDPPTAQHAPTPGGRMRTARMGDESTGELDIDSVDLIDEDD